MKPNSIGAVLPTALLWAALFSATTAQAAKPPVEVPARPDALVERLPRGYGAASTAARTPASRATLSTVQAMIEAAQRTGDARLAARADALLLRLPESSRRGSNGLLLAAMLAQHRHDFPTALRLLDRAIALEPLGTSTRQTRAQIHLVQGRITDARRDCATLIVRDTGAGSVCVAAVALRTGKYDQARQLADRVLATPALEPALARHVLVMRGEIASRSGEPAEPWFDRALALDPNDVRTLAAYSAHLLHAGKPARVREILAGRATTETLQLYEALAARALRSPDSARLSATLSRRYALSRALGTEPELRDEAELRLAEGDGAAALRLARENFTTQRDHEDVDVLLRSAKRVGDTRVLDEVRTWATREGVPFGARR